MITAQISDVSSASANADRIDQRIRRLVALHFDERDGAAWWVDRARALGINAHREVRSLADLEQLGPMTSADLCERPLRDYVPRVWHDQMHRMIVGQTGGTTGGPDLSPWTAYRHDEFDEAFVHPFHVAAEHVGFPRGGEWLFAGPSGPHVIGKVVRALAAGQGAADPFSVDFDPRWAKKLPAGSFAMSRYLEHVVEQAMAIISRQSISVLFTTPVVLRSLALAMSESQREAILGVHYGGMALSKDDLADFQNQLFPNAVHLSGYGNTLFGCCLELDVAPGRTPTYFPYGERLLLNVVPLPDAEPTPTSDVERGAGQRFGRIRFTRLDESMLIVNMLERDVAELAAPPADAPPGFDLGLPGVRDPMSPRALAPEQRAGLY